MNKRADDSWIPTLSFLILVGILYIPTFYDGFCVNSGDNMENIGVCTRNWMQSVGTMLIPLAALYFTIVFKKSDDIKRERHETINTLQMIQKRFSDVQNLHNSFQNVADIEIKGPFVKDYPVDNMNSMLKILYSLGGNTRISEIDIFNNDILDAQRSINELTYWIIGYIENEVLPYDRVGRPIERDSLSLIRNKLENKCNKYLIELRKIEIIQIDKIRMLDGVKIN